MDRSIFREELNRQLIRFSNSSTIMVEARAVADTFRRLLEAFDELDEDNENGKAISSLQTLYAQLADKVGEIENIVSDQDDRIESLEKVTSNLEDSTSDLEDIRKDIVDMDAVRGRYVDLTGIVSRHSGILQSIEEAFK